MSLTSQQKQHVTWLLRKGNKLEAIKYFKETLNIELKEAHALTEKLLEEMGPSARPIRTTSFRSDSKIGRWVGFGVMSIGLIMLLSATYVIYSNMRFEKRAMHVRGKVIDLSSYESSDDDGGSTTMYTPVFEYAFNGQTYQHTSSTSSSSPAFEIGEEVEVLVDPQHPEDILVNSFWEKWFLPLILGIMGVMFGGMGYLAYRIMGG